jgi:hypothetical protein
MSHSFTFYHFVPDIYDPDMDAEIEVTVDVAFEIQPAEPDVGIMSSFPEDICVVATDCALFDINDAERFLDSASFESQRVLERIGDAANEDDGPDPDYEYDRRRDDRITERTANGLQGGQGHDLYRI